ncbi:HAD family hydrolase [Actinomycetaceae bacterium TAE3-ERU4]|nr:HAD family hydrolase [Actinomycetaceae bacterium TAE3-ERU4]
MSVPQRAVIFDMDDTLVVTKDVKWEQHKFVAKHSFGVNLTDETLAKHWGKPFGPMLECIYEHSAPQEVLISEYRKFHADFPKLEQPGAVQAVSNLLSQGVLVGVITSMLSQVAHPDLVRLGFPVDDFLILQGAEATQFHKPDYRVFTPVREELEKRGISPQEVTYVGDALMDLEASKGAGFNFLGVSTGLFAPADFPSGTPVFPTLLEALDSLVLAAVS